MKGKLRVDHQFQKLVMEKRFEVASRIVGSEEYNLLQRARNDYPNYDIIPKHIQTNPEKQIYKNLTYDYMREYIKRHEYAKERLAEFEEMTLRAKGHKTKYARVKEWFLAAYIYILYVHIGLYSLSFTNKCVSGKQNSQIWVFRKTDVFVNIFGKAENRRKRGKNRAFLFKKLQVPFCGQLVLFILHQVRWLAIQHRANLIKCINWKMLYCSSTDCRNCRGTNTGFFCKFFLCHLTNCKHYFYFKFYHINTAFLVSLFYHVFRYLSIRYAKNNYDFFKEITQNVLTNYVFRGIIYIVNGARLHTKKGKRNHVKKRTHYRN